MKTLWSCCATLRRWAWLPLLLLALACGKGGSPATGGPTPQASSPDRLRIEVKQQGLVRMDYADLLSAGFIQGPLAPGNLHLSNQGQPVALNVVCADGRAMGAGDYFEFFAQAIDTEYTGTNVYWLSLEAGTPSPMATRAGAVSGSSLPLAVFQDTLQLEQNLRMNIGTPGAPQADHWFWVKLTAPTAMDFPFQVAGLAEANGISTLRLNLLGSTSGSVSPDHHVRVSLNGVAMGDLRWTGITTTTQDLPLPPGALLPGANTLTLSLPGDTGAAVDAVLLNYFQVQVWRPLAALAGSLAFTLPANNLKPVQAGGFSRSDIRLMDITDPWNAAFIQPSIGTDPGGTYHLLFQDSAPTAKRYLAFTADLVTRPTHVELWHPGALRDTSAPVDYILITPRAFLAAAEPLCSQRRAQGLRVRSVAVEDIYNEFGQGFPLPEAIKAYLDFAYHAWATPPTYVLLLGDATFDYRDRMGTGKLSQVPCHLTITSQLGLTPDDNWYVAVDGVDEVPVMRIGRVPAATPTQVTQVVQKFIQYESAATTGSANALFVADNNDAGFASICNNLAAMLPASLAPTKIYLANYSNFNQCTQDIILALNKGMLLTTYSGHGDVTEWAGEMVFDANYIPFLTNGNQLTFSFMLNCENGWFAMPGSYCLAESLVAAQGRGAIGAFACSGLGYVWEQNLLGTRFYSLIFNGTNPTLGEACSQAKILAYRDGASLDLLRTFTLIGDPAMRLKRLP